MRNHGGEKMKKDPRNMWMGCCVDGVNPHGKKTTRSMMCIVVCFYNLPPHLRGNYEHLDVWGIFDGKPKNTELIFDVLVDDLLQLWKEGVWIYDGNREEIVKIYAMLVNMLHDYPG
jgi:hypothetical protein